MSEIDEHQPSPPKSGEYVVLPPVETPRPTPLLTSPEEEDAVDQPNDEESTWQQSRQFSLKHIALVTLLLSLMLAPIQWLAPSGWAGLMGLATLAFLILASLVSIPRNVMLLIASLLLTVYVAAAIIAACLE